MKILTYLKKINPWHFLWISICVSEIFTLISNTILSLLWWGTISTDLLLIGTIDALVVSLIVASIVIYFLKHTVRLEDLNLSLEKEVAHRKGAEKTIAARTSRFQSILDLFPGQVMVINQDYSVDFINAEARKFSGPVTSGPIMCYAASHGRSTPCRGTKHTCPLRTVFETGQETVVEHIHTDEQGRPHIMEIFAVPFLDQDGNVSQVIEFCHDITLQRTAEKQLRENEERYRNILEVAPDVITITRLDDGRYIEVNDYFTKITGYRRNEVIGKTPFDLNLFVDPQDRERIVSGLRQNGEVTNLELQYRKKDGTVIDTLLSAKRLKISGSECLVAVTTDITDHKKSDIALGESEEKYRLLVENQSDLVVKVDLEGRFLFVSPSYCKLFGKSEDELLGNTYMPLVHEDDRQTTAKAMEKLFEPPYVATIEQRALTGSGWRWLSWLDTAVLNDAGEVDTIIGVGRDITEQKKAEIKHKELETQLYQAQKMEAIGTLAGGIAHDFNNILSAIIGYSEIVLNEKDLKDEVRGNLRNVLTAGNRARDLVRQILAFSRQHELETKPFKLKPLVNEALELLRATIPANIDIVENLESEDTIKADASQIHQVIMNLCTNAAHAMQPEDGRLSIGLQRIELDDDGVENYPDIDPGSYLRLIIEDTGHGMPPEVQKRVFDPFFTTKKKGEGTGMGLSVADGIVKHHGGFIKVRSTVGQGSRFSVFLPVIQAEQSLVDFDNTQLPTGNEHVLFVDDEFFIVDLTRQILESLGYRVTAHTSSLAALEEFRGGPNQFDIVVTDLTMPEMTGDTLARKLLDIRPDIPIVLSTGYSQRLDEQDAKKLGIREFVMKPMVIKTLAEVMRRALDE